MKILFCIQIPFFMLRFSFQDLPILDPNDLLRLLRNFRVVRNNDKRLPELRSTFHQQPHRILARPRIQISGRLVCENDAGFCDECTGDCHTLLLSAGKLRRAGMQFARNTQDPGQLMEHLFIRCSMVQIKRDQNIICLI